MQNVIKLVAGVAVLSQAGRWVAKMRSGAVMDDPVPGTAQWPPLVTV